ncbi:MAG: FtsX-like permease family protein [Betaproteobacteria bacterium]
MIGRLLAGPLLQYPGRSAISVAAIALGVALGFAVQLINASAIGEFAQAARAVAGQADLTVRGARDGFDEALYPLLSSMRGVAAASPALEVEAKLPAQDEPLHIVGLDVFRAARLQPALLAEGADLLDTLRGDTVFLSPAAMSWLGVARGSTITVQSGLALHPLRVAGMLAGEDARGRLAVMDIGAAQDLFGRAGFITRIDLRLAAGIDVERFALALELPAGVTAERPGDAGAATGRMTRAYRVNLNVLALVALFTGALLVFSTQALSIARRRTQIALLRVIGCTRTQLVGLLVAEGLVLGTIGAMAGLAAGLVLAQAALRIFGADLGAGFFSGVAPELHVSVTAAIVFGVLGIAAALAGSFGPALEAARAAPAVALKSGDDQRAFAALRPAWPGVLLVVGGAAAAWLPPVGGLPLFGYLAIAALLVGVILLMPRLTAILLARLPRSEYVPAALALAQLRAHPAQAAMSLAAIVAAVSLMVSMAVMVASFRDSLDDWLASVLPADLYLRSGSTGDSAFFSPEDQRRIRSVAGIERIEFLRWRQIVLDPAHPRITLLARDGVDQDAERRLPLVDGPPVAGTVLPRAWVSEPASAVFGLVAGTRISLPLGGSEHAFLVAGVWRDYARQNGAVLIDRAAYIAMTGDRDANDAGAWLAPGVAPAEVERSITRMVGGATLEFAAPGEIRERSLTIFDRTFAVTYALEAAAVLIGLVGLSSGISSQVLARRREFGVLRHLGVTRAQISWMLMTEGFAVGAVGLAVGAVLGFGMSQILIRVVNRQSFHWGMELHVPWGGLAVFAAAMLLLAAATAALSGRQAMAGDAVRAVKEDW